MKFVQIYINKYTFYEFNFSAANLYDLYFIRLKKQIAHITNSCIYFLIYLLLGFHLIFNSFILDHYKQQFLNGF